MNLDSYDLRAVSKELAQGLIDDLKAGRLKKIGADEVECACDLFDDLSPWDRETLIRLTCRAVVTLVV